MRWLGVAALALLAQPKLAPPPLPMLPSVSRVRVDVAEGRVLVAEDVLLPRGEWRGGDLDLYVAFGAPGVPHAFDARLLAVEDGALDAPADEPGEPVAVERASRRTGAMRPLLGRPQMAGAVVHLREAAFRKALVPGGMAVLRLRSVLEPPPEDPNDGREIVVRLGAVNGQPITLSRIELVDMQAKPKVNRAEARLCGGEADPQPLSVAVTPKPKAPAGAPIAPVLAVRHASDDLCVRYFTER